MWWIKKDECCGCEACAQICPRNCIEMQKDEEGFYYPSINKDACVSCNMCEKACPVYLMKTKESK